MSAPRELVPGTTVAIPKQDLERMFAHLRAGGYVVVGPRIRDGAIVYDEITSMNDLPIGWKDRQAGGFYRLERRGDQRFFGFVVGPHSWKRYLYPPTRTLFSVRRMGGDFTLEAPQEPPPRYAFIGVRSCELAAMGILDRVLATGAAADPDYQARRANVFIVAVNCTEPGGTCFCASMRTGPKCTSGFDLALTELDESFVVEIGSAAGAAVLAAVSWRQPEETELQAATDAVREAATKMGRTLDTHGLRDLLYRNLEHPRWDEVAQRCLSCTNCTMVCPTCFCTDVRDTSDLTNTVSERVRVWDSCFNGEFSYLHGGQHRATIRARYRQWLTHKLASWVDQFGTFGCVGCGRCITWCPVGIDLTEEVAALRAAS
jgi:sulfhydrogenase subunit beta (sulfur reductase)